MKQSVCAVFDKNKISLVVISSVQYENHDVNI